MASRSSPPPEGRRRRIESLVRPPGAARWRATAGAEPSGLVERNTANQDERRPRLANGGPHLHAQADRAFLAVTRRVREPRKPDREVERRAGWDLDPRRVERPVVVIVVGKEGGQLSRRRLARLEPGPFDDGDDPRRPVVHQPKLSVPDGWVVDEAHRHRLP